MNKHNLSTRELEVLSLVVRGFNNIEIAKELCISPSTSKAHVSSILVKMRVENRLLAAVEAVRENLT